jgi:prophage regulatory protein
MEQQIIREKELIQVVGLSRTSIWRKEKAGTFPRRVKLGKGGRATGWLRSSVEEWLDSLKEPAGQNCEAN